MSSSSSRRSKGMLLDAVDSLTSKGLLFGGLALVGTTGYLLWGIFAGPLGNMAGLSTEEHFRIWQNVQLTCTVLTISGLVLMLSVAIRFYNDEVTGYSLLIGGAAFYWGTPIGIGASMQAGKLAGAGASPIGYIVGQFQVVGMIALALAVPFVLMDFWFKLRGIRRSSSACGAVAVTKEQQVPRSRLYLFCWQMPYCRDYLRKFCKAYEQRKPCWRIKSGCYCDEDMILRVMKKDNAGAAGFDPKFTGVATGRSKDLSLAQKRQRCRQCFLYAEHQKQKYRILSPLVFPITAGLMWMYLKPVKAYMNRALEFTDQLAGRMSYSPGSEKVLVNQWANGPAASETVLWLFLICIGLVIVTYLLRALEYAIFDMQM